MTVGTLSPAASKPANAAALLDVKGVAALLNCSTRHIYRLSDGGKMPTPLKLGVLVRWRKSEIESWIAGGCRAVRAVSAHRKES